MLIRRYQPEDTDALLRLWEEASRLAHPFLEEPFFDSERANIVEVYLPAAETWVAESGQRLAGFVSLLGTEIGGLFVDAGFHRQGTGALSSSTYAACTAPSNSTYSGRTALAARSTSDVVSTKSAGASTRARATN